MLAVWPTATCLRFLEKPMKNRIRTIFALAILCAAMSTDGLASNNAYLYLVQGVPGLDYATGIDPQFPVDVQINDEACYVHGLAFGTIVGPLTFTPGSYDIRSASRTRWLQAAALRLSTHGDPRLGKEHLSRVPMDGMGAPALSTFTNNFSVVAPDNGRILFALSADSPAVQATVENTSTLNVTLLAGTVEVKEGTSTLVPSTNVVLYSQSVTLLYAIEEASNSTVTLENTVRDVI